MTPTRSTCRHASARGFSLVELLVVTAIVAVLAGLLLPAMGRARQKAVQAACLSNLRQAGLAFTLYLGDHADRFPDARSLKAALGYRPWTGWPQSDPRAGWAPSALRHHGDPRIWLCPAIARSPLQHALQVVQSPAPDTPTSPTSYWLWRLDRTNDPVPLDNFWGKSAEQALHDLRAAHNPVVGQPSGPSEVELAVDVYFPATLPGVAPELVGRAAHPGGRNRLMLDQSAAWTRDPRLTRGR